MVVIFSCSDVYIKLQVVADTRLDGGTEEQRHERAETCSCNECSGSAVLSSNPGTGCPKYIVFIKYFLLNNH